MALFFLLVVFEHIGQEIYRLLVAMQRPLFASFVLFIRMGAWVWVAIALMYVDDKYLSLNTVFISWSAGGLLAIFVGGWVVNREVRPWSIYKIDWCWIKSGFRIGLLFLVATMSFRAIFTVDRYFIEYLLGAEWLGAYVLYISFALAAVNFIEPAVFSFLYPKIVTAYKKGEIEQYAKLYKEMAVSAILVAIALSIFIALIAPWVLNWIGRNIYLEYLPILWVLLLMSVIYAAGMVPHYGLYAKRNDKAIMFSHVSSFAVFAIFVLILYPYTTFYAVPFSLLLSFVWMGLFKQVAYMTSTDENVKH
jgi:O-antigen/teichoic acid export membrane protein